MLNKETLSKYITPLSPIPTDLRQSGKLHQKIKCLLFDIYGTLFVSGSGDIRIAKKETQNLPEIEKLLKKYRINKTPHAILDDLFNRIDIKHAELRKKGIDFPEIEIDQIWTEILENSNLDGVRKFATEFELLTNPIYPMPHLSEMIATFNARKMLMGLISNAQFYTPYLFEWFLDSDLESLGFSSDITYFSYRFGYAKPSLFLFQSAADKLKNRNIQPHSVLYIGNDMLKDIYPAQSVGFSTALFAGDARSLRIRQDDQKCKHLTADFIITDLMQLVDLIK